MILKQNYIEPRHESSFYICNGWDELKDIQAVAASREFDGRIVGMKDKQGYKASMSIFLRNHFRGAIGEYSVAKAYELEWTARNNIRRPDVADFIEVKSVDNASYRLQLTRRDPKDSKVAVIVRVASARFALIDGWAYIPDVIQDNNIEEHRDDGAAYYLDNSKLRPMSELASIIVEIRRKSASMGIDIGAYANQNEHIFKAAQQASPLPVPNIIQFPGAGVYAGRVGT